MVVDPRGIASVMLFLLMLVSSGCLPAGFGAAEPVSSPTVTGSVEPNHAPSSTVNTDGPLRRAQRELRDGDVAAALRDFRQATSAGGAPPEAHLGLGEAEMAGGDAAAAREEWQRLLASQPAEPVQSRARMLLATAELALGNWEAVLRGIDAATAPDGLADLAVLRRAEAAAGMGNLTGAAGELRRPELQGSTNRILLEQAGQLAERVGEPDLAARYFARSASYPAWTADRSRVMEAAGGAFEEAGEPAEAVEQYRILLETYGWTKAAERAGERLEALGGLTAYHRGLLAGIQGDYRAARAAFVEAASGGEYAAAASRQLRAMEETDGWRAANDEGSAEAFRSFLNRYPDSTLASEARFQEGMVDYEAGSTERALAVWSEGVAVTSGDERARLLLWSGKALQRLGREPEARARLQLAAEVHPAGYYALRARDLLDGRSGWPEGGEGAGRNDDRAEAEAWLAGWAGQDRGKQVMDDPRVRRGLGLAALGLPAEAEAEFNGLIAESRDGWFLFRLAGLLGDQEEWAMASRAATQLIGLSPAKTVTEAPKSVQRLVYPIAFPDLVKAEAERQGVDPLLLLALAYQESRFDPFALSLADARGLTQVIPPTGKGIASALNRPDFSPDDLYRPAVAVEFGAWYLANQLSTFGGDPYRALAAYNAGAGPIPRWAAGDPDLFLERIDYSETRSYVRQVYLHHALYRRLQNNGE